MKVRKSIDVHQLYIIIMGGDEVVTKDSASLGLPQIESMKIVILVYGVSVNETGQVNAPEISRLAGSEHNVA